MSNKEQELKQKILIADDSEMNRAILADMLESEYEIIEVENGVEAVAAIQQYGAELSLILLDIVMPEMDGFGVLDVMNKRHWIENIPVIMISSESGTVHVRRAYELGITDYISRPFDALVVHRRVVNTLMLYAKQKKLAALVMEQIEENEKQSSLMIDILSHTVEFRNGESGLHVIHIRVLTELFLKYLSQTTDQYQFSREQISMISTASALHDIGKISIPGEILNKPGRLTKEEFDTMKTHTTIGAEMLKNLAFHQEEPLVKEAYAICRWHHERYDGRGYPDGLKGDEIPISAQIVAMADVYDALTSERVYKKAFSHDEAIRMICNGECGTFNPLLLKCLKDVADTLQDRMNDDNAAVHQTSEKELQEILEEKLQPKESSASERTVQLLEHERMKRNFYASMSDEIEFEYTAVPPMVTLSSWGAERLKLPEVILNPFEDPTIRSMMDEGDRKELSRILHQTSEEDAVIRYDFKANLDGESRWIRIICRAMWSSDEEPVYMGVIGKAMDVHEARLRIDALERMASHDTLTKLLNYDYAKRQIQKQLQEEAGSGCALMLIDVNGIKGANDRGGRQFGDEIIIYVADRIQEAMDEGGVAARISGDEFLVFTKCEDGIEAKAEKIARTLGGVYEGFEISASIGAAGTEHIGTDYDVLFHGADAALRAAKKKGQGRIVNYRELMKK